MPVWVMVGIVFITLWAAVFMRFKMRGAARRNDRDMRSFLEDERAANNTRKKEIDPALYYTPDLQVLPMRLPSLREPEDMAQAKVKKCAQQTMIRFSERVTNLALKCAYGPMQLEIIASYEENFNSYIAALIEWAEARRDSGQPEDALRILEHTIEIGSEYKKSFMLAADMYCAAGETEQLNTLLQKAEKAFTDEGIRRRVINHIMNKRNEAYQ